jgi:hypothetical protein
MKTTLLLVGLSLSLLGCGSKGTDPAPATDPFLGRWQADNFRSIVYEANGTVKSDQDQKQTTTLEVTPTTMTFTGVTQGGTPAKEVNEYVRTGELITYPKATSSKETVYARNLTSTGFKLEFNGPKVAGKTYYIQSFTFHR